MDTKKEYKKPLLFLVEENYFTLWTAFDSIKIKVVTSMGLKDNYVKK